uniref:Uncharacterized protein n=1 Tax=Globisporangium ultimum (strain ATCC 200006 / CBS 805.95 / DAOM BR144) TaxID=431595 RepID=K3WPT2_GLOUD
MAPRHEMVFLPVEEDTLLFRICFYYGLLVVFLEVIVPLVFHRRLRLALPSFMPEAPMLSDDEFQQQKTTLEDQLRIQKLTSARKKKQQLRSLKKLALSSEKKNSKRDPGHVDLTRAASRIPSPSSKSTPKDRLSSLRASEAGTSTDATAPSGSQEFRLRYSWMRENGQKEEAKKATEVSLPASKLQPSRSSLFSAASSVTSTKEQHAAGVDTGSTVTSKRSFSECHHGASALRTAAGSSSSKISDTQKRQVQREERRYSWQKDKATSANGNASLASQCALPASTTHSVVSQTNSSRAPNSPSLSSSSFRTFISASLSSKPSLSDRKRVSLPQKQSIIEASGKSAQVTESLDFRSRFDARHYDQEEEEKGNASPLAIESPRHRSLSSFAPSQNSVFDDSDEEFLSVIRHPARSSPIRSFSTSTDRTHSSFANEEMDVERTIAAAFGSRPLARLRCQFNIISQHHNQLRQQPSTIHLLTRSNFKRTLPHSSSSNNFKLKRMLLHSSSNNPSDPSSSGDNERAQ